ncbi:hypothetical protein QZH41_009032, partial [Actinostola sp. cb2023]
TGCQVLLSQRGNHTRRIKFFKYMFMLCYPYQEEILLDFAMYLVKDHKNITEAFELMNGKSTKTPLNNNKLLQAYMGLFEYILWKTKDLKERRSRNSIGVDMEGHDMELKQNDNIYHANKALQFFDKLVENEGVWDVFVMRQVELLMFFERNNEAQTILERYREKNPENPNTHRYLYSFHKLQDAPKSTLLAVLENLFTVNPTSELVQEYYELVMDKETISDYNKNICTLFGLLFSKLDYHSCKTSLVDWKALAHILHICNHDNPINKGIDDKVKACWDERADWWPDYHFSVAMVTTSLSSHDFNVTLEKAKVAKYLLSKGL